MKTLNSICIVAIMALVFTSCKNEAQPEVKTVDVEVTKKDVAQMVEDNEWKIQNRIIAPSRKQSKAQYLF